MKASEKQITFLGKLLDKVESFQNDDNKTKQIRILDFIERHVKQFKSINEKWAFEKQISGDDSLVAVHDYIIKKFVSNVRNNMANYDIPKASAYIDLLKEAQFSSVSNVFAKAAKDVLKDHASNKVSELLGVK